MATIVETVIYGSYLGAGLVAEIGLPPPGDTPHPILLSIHGGRWIRGTRHDNGAIDVKRWADDGYFGMAIDYRLVTCSPAPACYEDVLCAIRYVHAHKKKYNLDTSKFYVVGQSAGGHMATLAATLGQGTFRRTGGWDDQPHTFTAAISISGAYDLVTLDWGSGWIPNGEPWDKARFDASPLNHVSETCPPLLILHSDDDPSVPVDQAIRFVAKLAQRSVPHRFIHYTDRGHMLISEENVTAIRSFLHDVETDAPL